MLKRINKAIAWVSRTKWMTICMWRIVKKRDNAFRDAPSWFLVELVFGARFFVKPDDQPAIHTFYLEATKEANRRQDVLLAGAQLQRQMIAAIMRSEQ